MTKGVGFSPIKANVTGTVAPAGFPQDPVNHRAVEKGNQALMMALVYGDNARP